jgi:hypothetical protein
LSSISPRLPPKSLDWRRPDEQTKISLDEAVTIPRRAALDYLKKSLPEVFSDME